MMIVDSNSGDDDDALRLQELRNRSIPVLPGDRWVCIRCGKCCTSSFRTDWLEPMLKQFGYLLDGNCPWYETESHLCRYYEKRPLICRAYPFKLFPIGNARYILVRHSLCSGFGKGTVIDIRSKIIEMVGYHELEYNTKYSIIWDDFESNLSVKILAVGKGLKCTDHRQL